MSQLQVNLHEEPAKPLVLIATGPSLTQEDVDVAAAHAEIWCVKEAYQLAPGATLIYAADEEFWDYYPDVHEHSAEKWTCNADAAYRYHLHHIPCVHSDMISKDENVLHSGGNSGFQLLNLAILRGYTEIYLLGYDMGVINHNQTHFFGNHPPHMRFASPYPDFIRAFTLSAPVIEEMGVKVINCSRHTGLACFPLVPVEQAFAQKASEVEGELHPDAAE